MTLTNRSPDVANSSGNLTARYDRTAAGPSTLPGWYWHIEDSTGLTLTWGWCAGPKRDAQAEVRAQMERLGGAA